MSKFEMYIIGLFLGGFLSWFLTNLYFTQKPSNLPTTYECPCDVEQLVTDVISHTNKDGMTTVTTYIDIKECIQSNTN